MTKVVAKRCLLLRFSCVLCIIWNCYSRLLSIVKRDCYRLYIYIYPVDYVQ